MARIHTGEFGPAQPTIMLTSSDYGETFDGVGLRSHMEREDVDGAVKDACVTVGIAPESVSVIGSTCRTAVGNILGVVGVTFGEPLPLASAAAFAGALTAEINLTGVEVLHVNGRTSQVAATIPILA